MSAGVQADHRSYCRISRNVDGFAGCSEKRPLVLRNVLPLFDDKWGHVDHLTKLRLSVSAQSISAEPELNRTALQFLAAWVMIRIPLKPNIRGREVSLPLGMGSRRPRNMIRNHCGAEDVLEELAPKTEPDVAP